MARRRRTRSVFRGEPNGLQPGDEVGNRIPKAARQTVPDDIGNRRDDGPSDQELADDLGNRVDINPTHEHSGALLSVDGRKRRRRKGVSPQVRIGRYVLGGVNPMISMDSQRAAKSQDAQSDKRRAERSASPNAPTSNGRDRDEGATLTQRRSRRFFDFNDDDRYSYRLQSDPDEKRALAENTVQSIVTKMGREAVCTARVLADGSRPKVLVTIDEAGPRADLADERKPEGAEKPLFAIGNGALMSINYIANKIVNRFPNDRIRLAILPKSDEAAYLEALNAHQATRPPDERAAAPLTTADADGAAAAKAPKKIVKSRKRAADAETTGSDDASAKVSPSSEDADGVVEVKKTAKKAAPKKATTKKVTAKKVTAKKVTAKKAAAKKTTTKKVTAKKATAKKATTKKVTAKKAAAKKTTTKKVTAKKATAKKATTKKATTKKTTAKKTAKKKIAKKKTGS